MNHLPFTLGAYFLNSLAVLTDKFLLTKSIPDPLVYVFYFSVFSLVGLFVLPFTPAPSLPVLIQGSIATLLWTTGAYFMFKALQRGVTSRVIPIIGTLIPLGLLFYYLVFENSITINQSWAALLLTLGLFFLILPALRGKVILPEFIFEVVSSSFFAVSYVVLHAAYNQAPFLTVFSWSRLILIPVGVVIYLLPPLRQRVFKNHGPVLKLNSKIGLLFLMGQAAGGSAELLLTYSVALANPALVNSLQGTQYIFLMIFGAVLSLKYPKIFAERLTLKSTFSKLFGLLLVSIGLAILAFLPTLPKISTWGYTYSPRYATDLGLDPRQTFLQAIKDLQIKQIRIPVYWDQIEVTPSSFTFKDADYYLEEATKRGVKVTLVIGYKTPRWPECFAPKWTKKLSKDELKNRILSLVLGEVEHFKEFKSISSWQVENEPLLPFGSCRLTPAERGELLTKELAIVRQLDKRPSLLTDSGELSTWNQIVPFLQHGSRLTANDQLGITMYRTVWSPYFGQVDYPLPPVTYYLKSLFTQKSAKLEPRDMLIAELQAEPWPPKEIDLHKQSIPEQLKEFSLNKLKQNIQYANESGFQSAYLWGLEWWYFMAKHDHPEYINYIQSL